jgi:hypothetical protein
MIPTKTMTNEMLDYIWDTAKGMIEKGIEDHIKSLGHGVDLHDREASGTSYKLRYHRINYASRSNGRNNDATEITYDISWFDTKSNSWVNKTCGIHDFSCDEMWEIIDELEKQNKSGNK